MPVEKAPSGIFLFYCRVVDRWPATLNELVKAFKKKKKKTQTTEVRNVDLRWQFRIDVKFSPQLLTIVTLHL